MNSRSTGNDAAASGPQGRPRSVSDWPSETEASRWNHCSTVSITAAGPDTAAQARKVGGALYIVLASLNLIRGLTSCSSFRGSRKRRPALTDQRSGSARLQPLDEPRHTTYVTSSAHLLDVTLKQRSAKRTSGACVSTRTSTQLSVAYDS